MGQCCFQRQIYLYLFLCLAEKLNKIKYVQKSSVLILIINKILINFSRFYALFSERRDWTVNIVILCYSHKCLQNVILQIVAKAGDIYNAAISKDVLYKDAKGNVFKGNYKNLKQEVAYPDFSAKSISDWYDSLKTFLGNKITKSIDGFILTDNWPAQTAFHMGNNQHFPYLTEVSLKYISFLF